MYVFFKLFVIIIINYVNNIKIFVLNARIKKVPAFPLRSRVPLKRERGGKKETEERPR